MGDCGPSFVRSRHSLVCAAKRAFQATWNWRTARNSPPSCLLAKMSVRAVSSESSGASLQQRCMEEFLQSEVEILPLEPVPEVWKATAAWSNWQSHALTAEDAESIVCCNPSGLFWTQKLPRVYSGVTRASNTVNQLDTGKADLIIWDQRPRLLGNSVMSQNISLSSRVVALCTECRSSSGCAVHSGAQRCTRLARFTKLAQRRRTSACRNTDIECGHLQDHTLLAQIRHYPLMSSGNLWPKLFHGPHHLPSTFSRERTSSWDAPPDAELPTKVGALYGRTPPTWGTYLLVKHELRYPAPNWFDRTLEIVRLSQALDRAQELPSKPGFQSHSQAALTVDAAICNHNLTISIGFSNEGDRGHWTPSRLTTHLRVSGSTAQPRRGLQ
ncbi:hypothetical protein BDY19DRAFT_903465 [Irpex rosettiformis]|uniref:Uncharacterized protein n=1 Tax=Irpex rosettiformis TaxID=378272 RepID=A0ACB8UEB7_9APHY|nr:hypothetical protein BDY19DRAFT_903465 [Irpex rosettiformis]